MTRLDYISIYIYNYIYFRYASPHFSSTLLLSGEEPNVKELRERLKEVEVPWRHVGDGR
jgi:hypothetical protein